MSYSVAIHKPSSVRYSACTDLLTPGVLALVLARPSSIDVYSIQAAGLQLQYTLPVNGTVTSLLSFKPTNAKTSWLFVLTEDSVCFTLSYKDGRLVTEQVLTDLDDQFMSDTDSDHLAIMDPNHRGILLHINKGSLTYIPLIPAPKKRPSKASAATNTSTSTAISGTLYPPVKLPIEELNIISIVFLEKVERPTVAVLYRDGLHARHVKVYEIHTLGGGIEEIKGFGLRNVDQGASLLVPFPASAGGFFLLGEQLLTYFPSREVVNKSPKKIPFNGPINFCAAACIDDNGERFLLGDELGLIYMLQVDLYEDGEGHVTVDKWNITPIGETSIPTTLTYLDSGFFFVTSHFSPSSLFYLSPDEPHVQVVQVIPNLAPITDFAVIPRENTTDVIACSGAFKSGSLRIVKSGVGVDIMAELGGISGVTNLWTLDNDIIVASFIENTVVFKGNTEEGTFQELDHWNGVEADVPTIHVAQKGNKLVYINRSHVKLIDMESSAVVATYSEGSLAAAVTTEDYIIVATTAKTVVQLTWDFEISSVVSISDEISCLTATEDLCFVGIWNECKIAIFNLSDFALIGTSPTLSGNILRALKAVKLEGIESPILYAGMADGSLHSFHIGPGTAMDGELTEHKVTVLGTQPISLYGLKNSILAVSSHPVMIYGHTNKVTISSVSMPAPTALAVCKSASITGDSDSSEVLVFAVDDSISYGVIDQLMSTHVQTLKLEETARRLTVMSSEVGVIGLITLKTELDPFSGDETINCFVKVVDTALFEVVDSYALDENEMAESITSGFFNGTEYLIVGTGYASAEREEYLKGRILLFEVTREKRLSLALKSERYGGVFAMQATNGHLVCAINSIVYIFNIVTEKSTGRTVIIDCGSFRSPTMAICLSAYDDYVLVGDLMKSVTLLKIVKAVKEPKFEFEFEEIGRYYEPMWMTDVEIIDEETSVGAEAEGNIVVFQREDSELMAPEPAKGSFSIRDAEPTLQIISSMRVGEVVNRIRRAVPANSDSVESVVTPQAYYATRDGGIYLYGKIAPQYVNTLINLQLNMSKVVQCAGNLKISTYRAFANQRRKLQEPVRFVDGDFIELFLELSDTEKEQVVTGEDGGAKLEYSSSQITSIIEDLKRLH